MQTFFQSEAWARVEEARGHRAVRLSGDNSARGFVYTLPIVGKYLYIPRWPESAMKENTKVLVSLIETARSCGAAWVRIEPETSEQVAAIVRQGVALNTAVVKAPHDMQPRENLIIDSTKSEAELLAAMKSKVRYNIRLAEKKGVRTFVTREKKYQDIFCDLVEATARRQRILPHARAQYRQIFDLLPESMCQLVVAEYQGEVLAANCMLFYADTATYLHGGTSDRYREVMAPTLLQWECIREAKRRGCSRYDFGGVRIHGLQKQDVSVRDAWAGITRFKTGFSPETQPTCFPGCYDVIICTWQYEVYRRLRFVQSGLSQIKKWLRV